MPVRHRSLNRRSPFPSLLDIFVLSMLDRGLETSYSLQRRGGLSVGSTIPVLGRLETAGLAKKAEVLGGSKRRRHAYQLSAAGRKLARTGWMPLLEDPPSADLDALLRLADLASHYGAKTTDIASLFERAATDRTVLSRRAAAGKTKVGAPSLLYVATRNGWHSGRMAAEAKFLRSLAKSATAVAPKKSKTS